MILETSKRKPPKERPFCQPVRACSTEVMSMADPPEVLERLLLDLEPYPKSLLDPQNEENPTSEKSEPMPDLRPLNAQSLVDENHWLEDIIFDVPNTPPAPTITALLEEIYKLRHELSSFRD